MRVSLDANDLAAIAEAVADRLRGELVGDREPAKLLWSEREAAEMLGVSAYTLKQARQEGRIRATTTKRPILYGRDEIAAVRRWLEER